MLALVARAVFAAPSCAIAVPPFNCGAVLPTPGLSAGIRRSLELRSLWRASRAPHSSSRRSLFIHATTEQVALQSLSGSEDGEFRIGTSVSPTAFQFCGDLFAVLNPFTMISNLQYVTYSLA